jgi:hypothetical protein
MWGEDEELRISQHDNWATPLKTYSWLESVSKLGIKLNNVFVGSFIK